jgi:hypothetical protein
MAEDPVSQFVEDSHKEKGQRTKLVMKKELGGAGFCVRASGGKKAMDALAKTLNEIDLSEHQPEKEA